MGAVSFLSIARHAKKMTNLVPAVQIRKKFEQELSKIYAKEVPLYGELLPVVERLNKEERTTTGKAEGKPLVQEHHGAIRVGTAKEMNGICRLFNVMDMHPVNYYDLSVAGLPVHSTAFRDVTKEGLSDNAFRVFVSLLREDMLPPKLNKQVQEILAKREIITPKAMQLIALNEEQGGLTEKQADEFIKEAVKTFKRQEKATVSKEFYEELLGVNSLLADIVSFATPHLNHLTPRTDNIDKLFKYLNTNGITTTPIIQGPPKRKVPLLLRQMAFQAIVEKFQFPDGKGGFVEGGHRARFGEYETKEDAAVTPKGRELYDKLLQKTLARTNDKNPDYTAVLEDEFKAFPDTKAELRKQGLVYFRYSPSEKAKKHKGAMPKDWNVLVDEGFVEYEPVPYHDFLPVSAAGIFKSNLVEGGFVESKQAANKRSELEKALGQPIINSFDLYAAQEAESILATAKTLGVDLPKAQIAKLQKISDNDPAKIFAPSSDVIKSKL